MFFINKYYIASVWRAELDQKRRYIERSETNSNKNIQGVFGDTNLTKSTEIMTPFWLDWNKETLFNISDKAAGKEAT